MIAVLSSIVPVMWNFNKSFNRFTQIALFDYVIMGHHHFYSHSRMWFLTVISQPITQLKQTSFKVINSQPFTRQWMLGFLLLSLMWALLAGQSTWAAQVRLSPTKPRLGDTLSVVIQPFPAELSQPPVVQSGQKTYPVFSVGPGLWRSFIPTTPLERPGVRRITVTTNETQIFPVQVGNRSFPVQRIWLPPAKESLAGTDAEFDQVDAFKQLVTPQKFWNRSFLAPNAGPVTTGYGVRRYYNGKFAEDYYHRGIDYGGAYGSPVIAPAPGRVRLIGRESKGFQIHGNTIGIDHGQGVASIFIHLSRINVNEGDFVQTGQVIGAVGSTGSATGPHLHWGLYVNGQSVDPYPWRTQTIE